MPGLSPYKSYMHNVVTLHELREYFARGLTLEQVLIEVEHRHGRARTFDHETKLGPMRYFVMPLDEKGDPLLTKLKDKERMERSERKRNG